MKTYLEVDNDHLSAVIKSALIERSSGIFNDIKKLREKKALMQYEIQDLHDFMVTLDAMNTVIEYYSVPGTFTPFEV